MNSRMHTDDCPPGLGVTAPLSGPGPAPFTAASPSPLFTGSAAFFPGPGPGADDGSEYVPKHIRKLAARLVVDHNLERALAEMRAHYTNLSSLRGALTKLKSAVIGANARHPGYAHHMALWEERIEDEVVQEIASASSLQRLREFYAFRDCSLRRQLHIKKKIKLGQGSDFFCRPEDAEFVATTLPVVRRSSRPTRHTPFSPSPKPGGTWCRLGSKEATRGFRRAGTCTHSS